MTEIGISEYARQQIRKLFSQRNSVNTLKRDPELTQIFDNFAFDEALKDTLHVHSCQHHWLQRHATV